MGNPRRFRVDWGYMNRKSVAFADFDDALTHAETVVKSPQRSDCQLPTIVNQECEDYDTDGLTESQREQVEAIGLEVRRP